MLKLCPFFFYFGGFFELFFLPKLFLKFAILNRLFMYYFFSFFPNLPRYGVFYQTQMKLRTVSLKLFETICNCHSFTETGCKKKVVIGIKSAKSPVSRKKVKNVEWFQVVSKKLSNMKSTICRWIKKDQSVLILFDVW